MDHLCCDRKEDTDYNRFKRWNEKIADDPAWAQAILDRVQRMVERRQEPLLHHHVGQWETRVHTDVISRMR